MKKLMSLMILCCGFISAPLLSNESCVELLQKKHPTSCKAIGWYANYEYANYDNRYKYTGDRCFYKCGRQEYTSNVIYSASYITKKIVKASAGGKSCEVKENVITDENVGQYRNGFGISKRCFFCLMNVTEVSTKQ